MSLLRRLRHLLRRRQSESDMAEEMRFHLEQRAADYTADGLAAEEARLAAQRKFGNLGSIQERAREAHGWGWLERFLKDVRFAFQQLARSPGFTALAIVTLGLGIGANTSMFSALNGILLKPLPYPEPERLYRIYRSTASNSDGHHSAADVLDFQRTAGEAHQIAAYSIVSASLAEPGQPAEFAYAARSSVDLFSLLGVRLQLGRDFRSGEDTPGRDRVVILSQRLWRNRFGAAPDVIGRTVRVDGEPHEVIGVLPASFNDFRHLGVVDLFRPLALTAPQAADRHTTQFRVLLQAATTQTPADVSGFVSDFGAGLAAEFPEFNGGAAWRAVRLQTTVIGQQGPIMMKMLIGLSGFVLLIACANLANLLLARTISRAREFAVRAALGASRLQLLRPLIAEALLLSLAGGACAILVALWFIDWAAARSTGENGEQVILPIDWNVLAWASGASVLTALVFGIAPALFALRLDLNHTLKSGGRSTTGGRGQRQFGRLLILGQFCLAMILLTGAGLFIQGLHDLNSRRSGWNSEHLVTGNLLVPAARYCTPDEIVAFQRLALERLTALPGVASASLSWYTPFFNWVESRRFLVEGRPRPQPGQEPIAFVNSVSAQYFDTFGTRVIAGRAFDDRDTPTSGRAFVVSETTAQAWFGRSQAVGRRLGLVLGETVHWGEIVGVVNAVQSVVAETAAPTLQVYQAMAQAPRRLNEIAVRTKGIAPAAVLESVRTTLEALDPDLPLRHLLPADAAIARSNYQLSFARDILAVIAVLGVGLAALGVYGVITRAMAQRAAEFAIRLALGACLRDLRRLVLTSGVKLALLGSMLGLLGAFGVFRGIAASFPGMRLHSPPVIVGATLLLVIVALLACWLPARRAGKVDAMAVLRAE